LGGIDIVKRVLSHSAQALVESALIAILVLGLAAGTAFAAKGGGGGGGGGASGTSSTTFSGPVMVTDNNGNGLPNYMDVVTFNVSTTATSQPQVGLRCYQGQTFVYDGYVSFFDSWLSPADFTLGSTYWNSALSASCTARLFYYNKRGQENVLATLSFPGAP
jgi:hypothetical protein